MVCYMWSLSGLIGAFVDLAIAYFFLCASSVAYIASKFLGIFGLYLPSLGCTFLGSFPNSNYCVKSLLIDFPTEKVSNVQLSVLNKFPFKEFRGINRNNNVEIIDCESGSCSYYVSDTRKGQNVGMLDWESGSGIEDGVVVGEWGFDVKGKRVMNGRTPKWLRRRKREAHSGRNSSVASCDPQSGDVFGGYSSLSDDISKGRTEMVGDVNGHLDNAIDSHDSYWQRDVIVTDEFPDENDEEEKLSTSIVEMSEPSQYVASSFGDKNAVKLLKQALKEEQAAHTALYIELEKERSASASAADEAMAMILRLQEEKAMVKMEARQYQRIIEEKFAYDAEEMNILKDILLIQEREKHSLEKEVEEYRQLINLGNEHIQDDADKFEKNHLDSLVDPSEDPVFIIDKTSVSVDEKTSLKDMQTSPCSNNGDPNVQEKEMIPNCLHLYVPPQNEQRQKEAEISCEASSQEHYFSDKRIQVVGEEAIQARRGENLEQQKVLSFDEVRTLSRAMSDKELQVHDIHVIVDEPGLPDVHERRQDNFLLVNDISKSIDLQPATSSGQSIGVIGDRGSTSNVHGGTETQRSTSEMLSRLPPVGSQKKSISSGQLRNPRSLMDNERFKIDHEISYLRDRLQIIQEGREKLNLSKEHQERENVELKLLEDIARQLQAIRLLTECGKPVRQASLPPPFTKVTSKKRRSRSASSGVHKSS